MIDYAIRKDWKLDVEKRYPDGMPSLEALLDFLTNRAHTLELVEGSKNKQDHIKPIVYKKPSKSVNMAAEPQVIMYLLRRFTSYS